MCEETLEAVKAEIILEKNLIRHANKGRRLPDRSNTSLAPLFLPYSGSHF